MTTVWDRAVRALQPVHPDLDESGHPLAYYCGGPELVCKHNACRYVSALAEADLLHDGAVIRAGDKTLVRDPDDAQRVSDALLDLIFRFERHGASERAWGANYARMVTDGHLTVDQVLTGLEKNR